MTAPQSFTVDDVKINACDLTEENIDRIYAKVRPDYAVYRTSRRVAVVYSDNAETAAKQRERVAPLNVLRSEITALIDGWRTSSVSRAGRYDARVAGALIVALDGDTASATTALTQVKADILDERTSLGRFDVLSWGFGAVLAALLLFAIFCMLSSMSKDGFGKDMPLASLAGAAGAFFSLAIGIRGRTVLPNVITRDNLSDAVLRIIIGIIAASVLYMLLHSDLVTVSIDNAKLTGGGLTREKAVIIGFLAGFLERLVPDLLEKTSLAGQTAPVIANPAAIQPASRGGQQPPASTPAPTPATPRTPALAPPSTRPPSPDPRVAVG